jgi:hypothetical protein
MRRLPVRLEGGEVGTQFEYAAQQVARRLCLETAGQEHRWTSLEPADRRSTLS